MTYAGCSPAIVTTMGSACAQNGHGPKIRGRHSAELRPLKAVLLSTMTAMDQFGHLQLKDFLPWWQVELLNRVDKSVLEGRIGSDPNVAEEALAQDFVGQRGMTAQDIFRSLVIGQGGIDPSA